MDNTFWIMEKYGHNIDDVAREHMRNTHKYGDMVENMSDDEVEEYHGLEHESDEKRGFPPLVTVGYPEDKGHPATTRYPPHHKDDLSPHEESHTLDPNTELPPDTYNF